MRRYINLILYHNIEKIPIQILWHGLSQNYFFFSHIWHLLNSPVEFYMNENFFWFRIEHRKCQEKLHFTVLAFHDIERIKQNQKPIFSYIDLNWLFRQAIVIWNGLIQLRWKYVGRYIDYNIFKPSLKDIYQILHVYTVTTVSAWS